MPTLNIPESYVPGIQKLSRLEVSDIRALTNAFANAEPALKPSQVVPQLLKHGISVDLKDLQEIVELVFQLAGTFGAHEDLPLDQFVADVLDAMRRESDRFPEPVAGWNVFGQQLSELLRTRAVRISSRADDIQHEEPNIFTTARILTDLRPVFDPEGMEPRGALIIHNLKITYFRNGDYEDLYIALDNADVTLLRSILDRADQKTEALKKVIAKAELNYFSSESP